MSTFRWNITNQEVCTRLGWLKNKDTKLVGMEWKLNLWGLGRDEYKLNAMCKIHGCNKIYLKDVISLKDSYWLHTRGKHCTDPDHRGKRMTWERKKNIFPGGK